MGSSASRKKKSKEKATVSNGTSSKMPSYKLTYFDVRGRAEIIRLLFAQAGVKYEDVRIPIGGEEWKKLKPTMPTGTMPVLEVDGSTKIPNAQAIARYVAREYNLAGSNNFEQLKVDAVMEAFIDVVGDIMPALGETDEAKKVIFEEKTKPKLKNLEKMLAANGGNFFAGNKITVADITLFNNCDIFLTKLCDDPLKDFPKLKALNEKVSREPRIAAWVAKRPKETTVSSGKSSKMPSYKLMYFDVRGRAEIIRLLFAQAGVKYEDVRIPIGGEEWKKLKPTMPTGTMPVLEVDGSTKIPNAQAIARYVAREYNLAGSNNLEQLEVDAVMEAFIDVVGDIMPALGENDEAKKVIFEEKTKPKLKNLENMLVANGGNFFAGNKITVADITLFNNCDIFLTKLCDDPLKDFPKLKALHEKVSREPRIAAWVAKRPEETTVSSGKSSKMPSYKLMYFDVRGRAEIIRLLFAQAGVKYEDVRIPIGGEEWKKLKPTMPTGTMPVLEVDGSTKIPNAQAIARYVAREYNLAGSNNLEQLEIDAVMEAFIDVVGDIMPVLGENDETKKIIFEEKTKPKLKNLENMLVASGGNFFAGNKITVADITLFNNCDIFLTKLCDDPLKDFPKLKALHEKVSKEPRIAGWVAKRPAETTVSSGKSSKMPSYKLMYFDVRGRAEIIRLLFSQAGVKYEDVRIPIGGEEWKKLKPTMPTGTMPVLEVDGSTKIPNAQAIARYVAREYNLAGSNNLEQLEVDAAMEAFVDVVGDIMPALGEDDEAKKVIYEEKTKPKLKNLENMLVGNGGNFFAGNKITVADITLFNNCDIFLTKLCDDPLKDFPKLKALHEKVSKEPRIAGWVAKRPEETTVSSGKSSKMPSYKLMYFDVRGRAEIIRLLFAQAGVKYEDVRITSSKEDWQKLIKPTMPTGTVPVLEVDGGTKIPNAQAIARYVAREYNLAGSNNLEQLEVDAVMEAFIDVVGDIMPALGENDEAKKVIFEEKTKPKLKNLENMLVGNGGNFFAGNKITVADITLFNNCDIFLTKLSDDPLKDFPKLKALHEKVSKEPRIADWVAKRPQTAM
ncbi:uncharacterized protein [Amphiura filiformis]|uniref:uncharacterized protein n=1 Tax=Amphiura filiformis TaxID=82378 RepID=UPI003B22556F